MAEARRNGIFVDLLGNSEDGETKVPVSNVLPVSGLFQLASV